jgi:polyadenylation factor subunit 2
LKAVAWHPVHPLLVSGGSEGAILHWDLSTPDSTTFTQAVSTPRATLSQAHDSNVWSLAYHPFGHILVSASNDHTTRFWSRERPGDASSVFSGGGEKPPEIIDTSGQDEDDDAMVPGFGSGPLWGKEEDGGAPNEGGGGGGGYAEYPDDDFIPGLSTSDAASNRPNGQIPPPSFQQQHQYQQPLQESMYGSGEERRFDEFGRDRDIGSRSAAMGSSNDDWGRGGGGGGGGGPAHRSARFGPRRGGRY